MKIIFLFAATDSGQKRLLAPYRAERFLAALSRNGLEPAIVDLANDAWCPRGGDGQSVFNLLHRHPTPIVYTFGDIFGLASVWMAVARAGRVVTHLVTSDAWDPIGARGDMAVRGAWSPSRLRARHASGHVEAVIGTSRKA